MAERQLRAGAATANITPPLGTSLNGGMTDRKAQSVHDELHARCLVLDNGVTRLAIAVCDLCMLPATIIDRAKHQAHGFTGIPLENMVVSATHTHTAPTCAPTFQSDPDPAYLDWLAVRIADSIRLAAGRLQPARIGWGVGHEPSQVFNRRYYMKPGTMPPNPFGGIDKVKMNPGRNNPNVLEAAGPIDPEVGVIAVESMDKQPLAVLGNYALHYVGGGNGLEVSADYFAAWAQRIAELVGARQVHRQPPFVAILTNGCSGDINNVDVRHDQPQSHPYEQMYKVADVVAAAAYQVYRKLNFHDWVPLGAAREVLTLGVRKPRADDVRAAQAILAKSPSELRTLPEIYARETMQLNEYPDRVLVPVQALRIGDLAIVTFPGEAFVELGLEVKAKSPFKPTLAIGLANDYAGYVPTLKAHELGGYETWRAKSSFLEIEAAPKMVNSALKLLGDLWKKGISPIIGTLRSK